MVSSEEPKSKPDDEELEMVFLDISRAYIMAPMDREACSELLEEDLLPEDGDEEESCGDRCNGFRTARANWQINWQNTICDTGR